jgi:1,2-phenylacetyl-CoA epoxidase PaaB subunit
MKRNGKTTSPIQDPVDISYYAYTTPEFYPDADGIVDRSALISWDDAERSDLIVWDGDDASPAARHKFVYTSDDEVWVVHSSDIFSVVYEKPALEGGYGLAHPTGGYTSTWGYDAIITMDGDEVMVQRSCW